MVDMDMSCEFRVALRINLYDSVEQFRDTCAVAAHGRADRHTEKISELFYVQFVALVLELIVHVQGHHDPEVHVNDLGGKVQVSLDIGRVHDIDDNIRDIVNQVLADVQFLRAVSRKRVGSRQVHQHELVSLVFEAAFLGVHRHSAVVSDMLVRTRGNVEEGSLSAVRISYQCYTDHMLPLFRELLHQIVQRPFLIGVVSINRVETVVLLHDLLGLAFADDFYLFRLTPAQ